jgi:hypothetical protein
VRVESWFHTWLISQAERDDPVGDMARDYSNGVNTSDHEPADSPEHLLDILERKWASDWGMDAARSATEEWAALTR